MKTLAHFPVQHQYEHKSEERVELKYFVNVALRREEKWQSAQNAGSGIMINVQKFLMHYGQNQVSNGIVTVAEQSDFQIVYTLLPHQHFLVIKNVLVITY